MTDHTELIAEARAMDAGVLVTSYDEGSRTFVKGPSIVARLADALEAATTPPTEDEREALVTKAYNAVTGQDAEPWTPDTTLAALSELHDSAARLRRQGNPITKDELAARVEKKLDGDCGYGVGAFLADALLAEFDITRKAQS